MSEQNYRSVAGEGKTPAVRQAQQQSRLKDYRPDSYRVSAQQSRTLGAIVRTIESVKLKTIWINLFVMTLDVINTVEIIELMENYVDRIRPPEDVRSQLDIGYKIVKQSVILYEIRPDFFNPKETIESEYAKATYVKNEDKWRIYWMRGNLKWAIYEPQPKATSLRGFIDLVEEDKYHCFKG